MKNGAMQKLGYDSPLERLRYFPRQLMTPAEMTLEQRFFLNKLRRHNRLLHGWGIVCGVRVRQAVDAQGEPIPWTVEIEPGYVLDPAGNEILVSQTVMYNLRRESVHGHQVAPASSDPWCADVPVDRPVDEVVYIAICYHECEVRPVRVSPLGCGCDETACEYSRIQESFVIKALSKLPDSYINLESLPPLDEFLACEGPEACLPCPEDLCVILATVTPAQDGVLTIDCHTHRRYVVSFADYYLLCRPKGRKREDAVEVAERLRLHIDSEGMRTLEEEYGGAVGAVTQLPATSLRGLGTGSEAGRRLQERKVTIGQLADMTADEYQKFVDEVLASVSPRGVQMKECWIRAREVARITSEYRLR